MDETKYTYAFGQWVITEDGTKCRYLGEHTEDNITVFFHGIQISKWINHNTIRPDPDPPELVPGQLVMIRDSRDVDWKGPYKYIGFFPNLMYGHLVQGDGDCSYQYAKPYILESEKSAQINAVRGELADLKKRIQQLENRLPRHP